MVSKLRSALARQKGVDFEAKKVKQHIKEVEKKKQVQSNKRVRIVEEPAKEITTAKKNENKKLKQKKSVIEESESEEDDEDEDMKDEDDDEDEDEEEEYTGPIIDTSRLEDDLSSDSESEEEEIMAPVKLISKKAEKKTDKKVPAKAAKKAKQAAEEHEEDGIALSDLPSDSDEDDDNENSRDADIVPYQRLTINNTKALTSSLASIALPVSSYTFSEHMAVTSDEPTTVADANDDLNRELAFYNQALAAVSKGRSALKKENVPFSRPEDFFAEMVKSDVHMDKLARHYAAESAPKTARNGDKSKKPKNKKSK
ncbi:eukaryotic rRNA processing protein EBP2-domain-containing protein [Lipomyces arxii]|uniref:eukaryotic rRNA processing protein EBP2-domain-containing protein n=1 Tax=Lipomyces arxii TaxID=56418 RepID=UPI0034D01167